MLKKVQQMQAGKIKKPVVLTWKPGGKRAKTPARLMLHEKVDIRIPGRSKSGKYALSREPLNTMDAVIEPHNTPGSCRGMVIYQILFSLSGFLDIKRESTGAFLDVQDLISGPLGPGAHIVFGAGICSLYLQDLVFRKRFDSFFGFENGQGAVHSLAVQRLINLDICSHVAAPFFREI
jgi:hypothetical protein